MTGSDDNGLPSQDLDGSRSPFRPNPTRSASPAKRSAADMEGNHEEEVQVVGTAETQDVMSLDPATQTANTSAPIASSFASDASTETGVGQDKWDYSTEDIDAQVRKVHELSAETPDAGQRGFLVSSKWLQKVLSRTSDGRRDSEFPKEAREGSIGHVDNSNIVEPKAFEDSHLKDAEGQIYIPLKLGLSFETDFKVLNSASWGEVMASYGLQRGQQQITRYLRNTAPAGSSVENLMYELYPPIFTIRKIPTPDAQDSNKVSSAIDDLRKKDERKARGQDSPEDAARLVSSRQERFQTFLRRSKEAAEIPIDRKVRIWKVLDQPQPQASQPSDRPLSPPQSRENSRDRKLVKQKLVVEASEFKNMEVGKHVEAVEIGDETNNPKYNGTSTMDTFDLTQSATLLLEEIMSGPAGGDFASASDPNKAIKSILNTKKSESKPSSTPNSGRSSPAPGSRGVMTRGRQRRDGATRGIVGLMNLGNTCYMNSALQCIRSVEELTTYFLSDVYKKEINTSNPLGHNGVMAKQYAGVLQTIYGDGGGSYTPSSFKKTLGQLQPLFSGYGQQDSQEFLSFLVDALHEDLNRIEKKPYTENPDNDDDIIKDPQAIIDLGEIYRANHAKRNDSVAMDLFNGFYKNTMECPECAKISITFDPYSLVTLQLPSENTFQHTVTFVPLHGTPVNHVVDTDKFSTIKALKISIASKHDGVDANRLWMAEVYNHRLYKVFDNAATLAEADIRSNDFIFMFELDQVPSNLPTPKKKSAYAGQRTHESASEMDDPKADNFAVPVFSRQKSRFGNGWDLILHPMYVVLSREEAKSYDTILRKALIAVSRLTSRPILKEFGSKDDDDMVDASTIGPETEDNAQVSEHSLPSEDGYVEVSLSQEQNGHTHTTPSKSSLSQPAADSRSDSPASMESDFVITEALRTQLFTLKYGQGDSESMYCTGMTGLQDRSIQLMQERIKVIASQDSMQSDSSDDSSTTTASSPAANGEVDESDAETDDLDKPDIVMGEMSNGAESYLGMPTPAKADDESDNESLPENAFSQSSTARSGRRKNGKNGKGRRNRNVKTYSRKERKDRAARRNRQDDSHIGRFVDKSNQVAEENPYFIKIGEGIVLDWFPDALKEFFDGDPDDEEDNRGHFVSSHDGKNLPTVDDPVVAEKQRKRDLRRKHGITLDDCFTETGRRERLSEDNAWFCNRCKKLQQATKTLEIWTIPDILVVHLKRFGGNRAFRDKIDTMVDYPIEGLDMTDRVGCKEPGKEYIYDLFAVDNHFGGLGGGHYTAMGKNFYDGQWYDYNDASSHKLNEKSLHSAAAYLLFYRRRSDKPLGPQYLQDLVMASRNPQLASGLTNDESADPTDAGEARLGGQISSLRGSPSNSTVAGAGAATAHGHAGGSAGATPQVGSSPTTKKTNNGITSPAGNQPSRSPQRSPLTLESNPTWGFNALDDDSGNEMQHNMGGPIEIDDDDEDDVASLTAEADFTDDGRSAADFEPGLDFDHDISGVSAWSHNSPLGGDDDDDEWANAQEGDHALYSDAHARGEDGASFGSLHLDNAGAVFDPPPVDIVVDQSSSASPPPHGHSKLD